SLEGGEGAGKSTQIRLLERKLRARGLDVLTTREPGGVPAAEALRTLLLTGGQDQWTVTSEALLMTAARVEHWHKKIAPALTQAQWVLCDRFSDSTIAYQGIAGGLGVDRVKALQAWALGTAEPDLTLVFDIPAAQGLQRTEHRAGTQAGERRFEDKGETFHNRIAEAYRQIAKENPLRCTLINADQPVGIVESQVWAAVASRFSLPA
ncbi:MAG TPA: dTMP kinase, partial [Alphaproteobacteria bacterium]|nr:dTMP kinase [Alphaproteobacteria bacterium]